MSSFPETSLEAKGLKTDESKNRDYQRIVEAYKVIGSGHYEDVAKFLGLRDLNIVSRRMKEMREKGMLVNTGLKKLTSRLRNAYVHTLSNNQPKTDEQEKNQFKKDVPASSDYAKRILDIPEQQSLFT